MIYNVAFLLWISLPSSDTKNFKLTIDSVIALGFIIMPSYKAIWKCWNSVWKAVKISSCICFFSRLKPLAMNLVRWGSTQMKCDLWCHVVREGSNIQCRHLTFLSSNMLLPWVSLNNHLHLDLLSGKILLPIWDFSYIVKSTKEWFFSEILFSPFNKQNPL